MAASGDMFCGICSEKHIKNAAVCWCQECEEGLCLDCQTNHSISKGTRRHQTLTIDNFMKLPSSLRISSYCPMHDDKYQIYCPKHGQPCCLYCIPMYHKECVGLKPLQDIVKNTKTSVSYENMECDIQETKANLEKIIKDRKMNCFDIKESRKNITDEIKQIRENINTQLNRLEQQILKDLERVEKQELTKQESLIDVICKKTCLIESVNSKLTSVKEFGTDLQAYLAIESFETEIKEVETFIQDLSKSEDMNQVQLKWSADDKLSLLSTADKFGSVSVHTSPSGIELFSKINQTAQSTNVIHRNSFDKISVCRNLSITIPKAKIKLTSDKIKIRACTVLPNGEYVFINEGPMHTAVVLNTKGDIVRTFKTQKTECATTINNSLIALAGEEGVFVIRTVDGKVEKKLMSKSCCGVTYHEGSLYCCVRKLGIQKVDLSTTAINSTIVDETLDGNTFVYVNKNIILYTVDKRDTILCYTIEGVLQWEVTDTTLFDSLRCITMDEDSNIYIVSHLSHRVIVMTPDGKKYKDILSSTDDLNYPRVINYEKSKRQLLVVNYFGPAFVYDISNG